MKVLFEASFRDLKKIKDRHLLGQVQEVIVQVNAAATLKGASRTQTVRRHKRNSYAN